MDEIDREIVGALVENARLSFRELGERVSLSANATAERVRRLQERGIIAGYRAIIDPAAAGRTLVALMDVRLDGPDQSARFDYSIRVATHDPTDLDRLIRTLKTKGGVIETDTRIALRTVVRRPGPVGSAAG
jgi:Lrp/AsnC family transcriptional regulator, leucine-responsive regulatory protein